MKEQWLKGLQWGAVASVATWIAPYLVAPFYMARDTPASWRLCELVCAAVAVPVFALIVLTWSRLSRAALLIVVAVLLWQADSTPFGEPASTPYALARFFFWRHGDVARFLPLLFVTPELPRLTVALALVGRWRDAWATLAGWRWLLVALGVLQIDRLVHDLGQSMYGSMSDTGPVILEFRTDDLFAAVAPFAILFGLAALPAWQSRART